VTATQRKTRFSSAPPPRRTGRALVAIAGGALALVAGLLGAPAAQAAPAIDGRLVDVRGDDQVVGVRVQLRADGASCGLPEDLLVGTAVTGASGRFSIDPTPKGKAAGKGGCGRYYLRAVTTSRWQGGFLGGSGRLETAYSERRVFTPSASPLLAMTLPGLVSGRDVDPQTGKGIAKATVRITPVPGEPGPTVTTRTNATGGFSVSITSHGLRGEELALWVKGPAGWARGYVTCDNLVVASWDDACSHAPGRQGTIRLPRA